MHMKTLTSLTFVIISIAILKKKLNKTAIEIFSSKM